MKRSQSGFTLIELLVVIAIIGLLATVTAVSVNAARAKSRDSKRVSDMKQIQKALELSYEPGSGYPVVSAPVTIGTPSTDVLCAKGASTGFVADTTAANCDAGKVFMGLVPGNAVPGGTAYTYRSTDANGAACTYDDMCASRHCDTTSGLCASAGRATTVLRMPTRSRKKKRYCH